MTRRVDWDALMRVGLGRLRMPPEAFWAMSPREFSAAMEGALGRAAGPMPRGRLSALMAAFPDGRKGDAP